MKYTDVALRKVVCFKEGNLAAKFRVPTMEQHIVETPESTVKVYDSLSLTKKQQCYTEHGSLATYPKRRRQSISKIFCFEMEGAQMSIFKDPQTRTYVLLLHDKLSVDEDKTSIHLHLSRKGDKNTISEKRDMFKRKPHTVSKITYKSRRRKYKLGVKSFTDDSEKLINRLIRKLLRKVKQKHISDTDYKHLCRSNACKSFIRKKQSIDCFLKKTFQNKLHLEMYPIKKITHANDDKILVGAVLSNSSQPGNEKKVFITRTVRSKEDVRGLVNFLSCYRHGYSNKLSQESIQSIEHEIESENINIDNIKAIVTVEPTRKNVFLQFNNRIIKKLMRNGIDYSNKTIQLKDRRFISGNVLKLKLNTIRIYIEETRRKHSSIFENTRMDTACDFKMLLKIEEYNTNIDLLLIELKSDNIKSTMEKILTNLRKLKCLKNLLCVNDKSDFTKSVDKILTMTNNKISQAFSLPNLTKLLKDYYDNRCCEHKIQNYMQKRLKIAQIDTNSTEYERLESICTQIDTLLEGETNEIREQHRDIYLLHGAIDSKAGNLLSNVGAFTRKIRQAYERDFETVHKNLNKQNILDKKAMQGVEDGCINNIQENNKYVSIDLENLDEILKTVRQDREQIKNELTDIYVELNRDQLKEVEKKSNQYVSEVTNELSTTYGAIKKLRSHASSAGAISSNSILSTATNKSTTSSKKRVRINPEDVIRANNRSIQKKLIQLHEKITSNQITPDQPWAVESQTSTPTSTGSESGINKHLVSITSLLEKMRSNFQLHTAKSETSGITNSETSDSTFFNELLKETHPDTSKSITAAPEEHDILNDDKSGSLKTDEEEPKVIENVTDESKPLPKSNQSKTSLISDESKKENLELIIDILPEVSTDEKCNVLVDKKVDNLITNFEKRIMEASGANEDRRKNKDSQESSIMSHSSRETKRRTWSTQPIPLRINTQVYVPPKKSRRKTDQSPSKIPVKPETHESSNRITKTPPRSAPSDRSRPKMSLKPKSYSRTTSPLKDCNDRTEQSANHTRFGKMTKQTIQICEIPGQNRSLIPTKRTNDKSIRGSRNCSSINEMKSPMNNPNITSTTASTNTSPKLGACRSPISTQSKSVATTTSTKFEKFSKGVSPTKLTEELNKIAEVTENSSSKLVNGKTKSFAKSAPERKKVSNLTRSNLQGVSPTMVKNPVHETKEYTSNATNKTMLMDVAKNASSSKSPFGIRAQKSNTKSKSRSQSKKKIDSKNITKDALKSRKIFSLPNTNKMDAPDVSNMVKLGDKLDQVFRNRSPSPARRYKITGHVSRKTMPTRSQLLQELAGDKSKKIKNLAETNKSKTKQVKTIFKSANMNQKVCLKTTVNQPKSNVRSKSQFCKHSKSISKSPNKIMILSINSTKLNLKPVYDTLRAHASISPEISNLETNRTPTKHLLSIQSSSLPKETDKKMLFKPMIPRDPKIENKYRNHPLNRRAKSMAQKNIIIIKPAPVTEFLSADQIECDKTNLVKKPVSMLEALTQLMDSKLNLTRTSSRVVTMMSWQRTSMEGFLRPVTEPKARARTIYDQSQYEIGMTYDQAIQQFQPKKQKLTGEDLSDVYETLPDIKEESPDSTELKRKLSIYIPTPKTSEQRMDKYKNCASIEQNETFFTFLKHTDTPKEAAMPLRSTDSADMRKLFKSPHKEDLNQTSAMDNSQKPVILPTPKLEKPKAHKIQIRRTRTSALTIKDSRTRLSKSRKKRSEHKMKKATTASQGGLKINRRKNKPATKDSQEVIPFDENKVILDIMNNQEMDSAKGIVELFKKYNCKIKKTSEIELATRLSSSIEHTKKVKTSQSPKEIKTHIDASKEKKFHADFKKMRQHKNIEKPSSAHVAKTKSIEKTLTQGKSVKTTRINERSLSPPISCLRKPSETTKDTEKSVVKFDFKKPEKTLKLMATDSVRSGDSLDINMALPPIEALKNAICLANDQLPEMSTINTRRERSLSRPKEEILQTIQTTLKNVTAKMLKMSASCLPLIKSSQAPSQTQLKLVAGSDKIVVGEHNGKQSTVEFVKYTPQNVNNNMILTKTLQNSLLLLQKLGEASKAFNTRPKAQKRSNVRLDPKKEQKASLEHLHKHKSREMKIIKSVKNHPTIETTNLVKMKNHRLLASHQSLRSMPSREQKIQSKKHSRSNHGSHTTVGSKYQLQVKTLQVSHDFDKTIKRIVNRANKKDEDELSNLTIDSLPPLKSEYPRRDNFMHMSVENTFLFKLVNGSYDNLKLEPTILCLDKNCANCKSEAGDVINPDDLKNKNGKKPLNMDLGKRNGKKFNYKKYWRDLNLRHRNFHGSNYLAYPVNVNFSPHNRVPTSRDVNTGKTTPVRPSTQKMPESKFQKSIEHAIIKTVTKTSKQVNKKAMPSKSATAKSNNKIKKNQSNNQKKTQNDLLSKAEKMFSKAYENILPLSPESNVQKTKDRIKEAKGEMQNYIEIVEDKFLKTFSLPEKDKVSAYRILEQEIKSMLDILSKGSDKEVVKVGISKSIERISKSNPKTLKSFEDPNLSHDVTILKELKTMITNESKAAEENLAFKKKTKMIPQPTACNDDRSFICSLSNIISNNSDTQSNNPQKKIQFSEREQKLSKNVSEKSLRGVKIARSDVMFKKNLRESSSSMALSSDEDYETICEETLSEHSSDSGVIHTNYVNVPLQLCTVESEPSVKLLVTEFNSLNITENPQKELSSQINKFVDKVIKNIGKNDELKETTTESNESSASVNGKLNETNVGSLKMDLLEAGPSSNVDKIYHRDDCDDLSLDISFIDENDATNETRAPTSTRSISARMMEFLETLTSFSCEKILNTRYYARTEHVIRRYSIARFYFTICKSCSTGFCDSLDALVDNLTKSSNDLNTIISQQTPKRGYRLMSFRDSKLKRNTSLPEFDLPDDMFLRGLCRGGGTRSLETVLCDKKKIHSLCQTMVVNLQLLNQRPSRSLATLSVRSQQNRRRVRMRGITQVGRKKKVVELHPVIPTEKNRYKIFLVTIYMMIFALVFFSLVLNYKCEIKV